MKSRFSLSGVGLALALSLTVACSKPPDDAKVTSDIQTKLGSDSGLQDKQINVQSANGTVTISGNVDNDAQRDAAAKYAAAEPGVKTVINNLQVVQMSASSEAAPAPSAPASEPAAPPKSRPSPSRKKHRQNSQDYRNDVSRSSSDSQSAPDQPSAPAAQPQAQQASAPPPPPPEPQKVTVPSGTTIQVRLNDAIDSATAQTGDVFHANLDNAIQIDGETVVPAHYDVQGHVVAAQASGKFQGRALLELQLDKIKVGDKWYNIETDHFKQETGSRGKNTAEKVGAGAVAGAILGGIFGGGKGAAIGSVAGAGAGGGVQAASKKPDIKLAPERLLTFSLQSPVTLVPTTKPAREGQKLDANSQ
jgi:BON domain